MCEDFVVFRVCGEVLHIFIRKYTPRDMGSQILRSHERATASLGEVEDADRFSTHTPDASQPRN